ncbi:MAG: STAS domain-containing protein [Acidobacteriota bacterium]
MTPSQSFKVETRESAGGAVIMILTGPLTIQTLFNFQQVARKETAKPIILDISGVPYMDSAGLGCVVSAFTSCQRNQRAFGITGLTPRIKSLFAVTHVDELLPTFDSLKSAEAAVKTRAE